MTLAPHKTIRPVLVLGVAGLIMLPCLAFLGGRLVLPGDGGRVMEQLPPGGLDGLAIAPVQLANGAWRNGDVVTTMAGISVGDWLRAALTPGVDLPRGAIGREPVYSVWRNGQTFDVSIRLLPFPLGAALAQDWSSYLFLAYLEAVSLVVFARRPKIASAQLLFMVSTAILSSSVVFFLGLQVSDLARGWPVVAWLWCSVGLYGLLLAGLLHFAIVFPYPRPSWAARRWLLALVYAGVWVPWAATVGLRWPAVPSITARLILAIQGTAPMTVVYFTLLLMVSLRRYQSAASETERRQLRWVWWGLVVSTVPWLGLAVIPSLFGAPYDANAQLIGLLRCAVPTAIAIAVLRERLFDIDRLINRTLVYGLLTASLAGIYFGGVLVLQAGIRLITGGAAQSQLAVVASTLAIAALFAPLRRRVQGFIDRRFFRRKYDASRTLADFASTARDETDLDRLTRRLVSVVEETVQPAHASLWLHSAGNKAPERGRELKQT